MVLEIFKIAPRLRDRHVIMIESLEILNIFNSFTLKQFVLVQSTKIECAIFPHKSALSGANVQTNRKGCTKCSYQKEWSFAKNYFTFWKILFQFKNLL